MAERVDLIAGFIGDTIDVGWDPHDSAGCVKLLIRDELGSASILLDTPERRDQFARAYMEACRRADGEPPAGEAREHG
jgi:hypothetical protein